MIEKYKRLERKLVAKGSIIDYYQDVMEIPNGNTAKWDFIKHNGAAAVIAIKPDGKILMVKQYRNALERETIEIPAGGYNGDETMEEAAKRELREETGYIAGNMEFLISIRTTVAFCNERIDIYFASDLTLGEQELDEDEYLEVTSYTIEELIQMIYSGDIQDSKSICGLMCYYNKYCK